MLHLTTVFNSIEHLLWSAIMKSFFNILEFQMSLYSTIILLKHFLKYIIFKRIQDKKICAVEIYLISLFDI